MSSDSLTLPAWTSDSSCSYHGDSLHCRLGLAHDANTLFEPTDFSLIRGAVTGLVGTNGSGKTSLAKVVASKELPGFPKDLAVQYVSTHENYSCMHAITGSNDNDAEQSLTPEAYLYSVVQDRLESLGTKIEQLEESLGLDSERVEETANQLAELYELQDELQKSAEREIQQTLTDLGFGPHLKKSLSQLSSGWRYKCRLAAAFTAHSDILIVDEPSFLDISSTKWLVEKVSQAISRKTMVLLISHKEALLETLCNRILYINSGNHSLSSYNCGYETFRATHMSEVSHAKCTIAETEERVASAQKSLKSVQSQLQRRERKTKALTTQNADQRFIKGKNKEAKQKADRSAAAKVKQLKMQASEMDDLRRQAKREQIKHLHISGIAGEGTLALFQDVGFAYDEGEPFIFQNLDARLEAQDRVLLRGPNGCGKSTFLRLLLGELEPTVGTVKDVGKVLYFPQTSLSDMASRHGHESAVRYLGNNLTETAARQHLGDFGLTKSLALRPIVTLSAGQRVRLWLSKQMLRFPSPALLVMDEISENLDVETRGSLSEILNGFVGAVIVVSHDEDFCRSLHPTQVWNLGLHGIHIDYVDP